jgi:cyclic pyranopterin phosphate synthase
MTHKLTHIDADGNAKMVDILQKPNSKRVAIAEGFIRLSPQSLQSIAMGNNKKGDVLSIAQLAGICGTKKTADLIPLCHPIPIDAVSVDLQMIEGGVYIRATVGTVWKTGVEMEALTAVTTAALTIYDMLKAIDKEMVIERIRLVEKHKSPMG